MGWFRGVLGTKMGGLASASFCGGSAKNTVAWAKIAHFAMVQKLVVVMEERIVASRKVRSSSTAETPLVI